jgi:superfamily II DNA or RNA helicase
MKKKLYLIKSITIQIVRVIKMMNIKVSNQLFIKNYSMELIDWCHKNLVLDNPEYHIAEKMGRWTGNIKKFLHLYEANGSSIVLPFGVIDEIWQRYINGKCEECVYDFAPLQPLKMSGSINLYDYQIKAVGAMKSAKNGILEAPCGSGKTQMGIALIKELGQKALWVTHTTDLLKQSLARAKQYFADGDFGVITDGKVHIGADITFATVQTLSNLDLTQYNNEWNVVVVDECHRAAGTPTRVMQFYKAVSHLKARHKYGLSATLDRADGLIKSVFALLGTIKHSIKEQEVGSKIIKANHSIIATTLPDSIEAYSDTDGTMIYNKLLNYISGNIERNELIARNIDFRTGRHHLVLSHRVEHLRVLEILLSGLGIKSAVVCATTPKAQRDFSLELARKGELPVLLATYSLAKEGLDIPILDTLHLATPNKNKAIVIQSVGRVERNFDGKKQPEICDYVDFSVSYCVSMYKKRKNIIGKRN